MSTILWKLPTSTPTPTPAEDELQTGMVDHVAAALGRLTQEFKDDPGTVDLVTILAQRYQTLEAVFWALLTMRGINTAIGVQLDLIGKIVGQARQGLDDDTYRRYIRARITTNRSDGVLEDLIAISVLVINDPTATITVRNEGTATVRVTIGAIAVSDALAAILVEMLGDAHTAGVRLLLSYSSSTPATTYRLDVGPGLDVGHLASSVVS